MNSNKANGNMGYVKLFFVYTSRVLWRAITTIAFLIVDAFGLILIFFNLDQPRIPLLLSLAIFGMTIAVSAFLTWRDELVKIAELERAIKEIKESIPEYSIDANVINNYGIKSLKQKTQHELSRITEKLEKEHSTAINSPLSDLAQTLKRINFSVPNIGMSESDEERKDRLAHQYQNLIEYDKRIKNVYKLNIQFESSRSDENVEFKLELSSAAQIHVQDNFIANNIPYVREKTLFGINDYGALHLGKISNPSSLYPYSYSEGNKAFSKLAKINAKKKYYMFDEDIYIETDLAEILLTATIHSTKSIEPQILKKTLKFKNIANKELSISSD